MRQQEHPYHKGKLLPSPFGWPLADEQCDDAFCWCKAGKKHVGAIKNVCGDGRCWCVQYWPTQYPGGMGIGGEHRRCECHECTQARADMNRELYAFRYVQEAEQKARLAERERCAKTVLDYLEECVKPQMRIGIPIDPQQICFEINMRIRSGK